MPTGIHNYDLIQGFMPYIGEVYIGKIEYNKGKEEHQATISLLVEQQNVIIPCICSML